MWTLEEGKRYLRGIRTLLKRCKVRGEIVGGVKNVGYSSHDLDILLTPISLDYSIEPLIEFGAEPTMDYETLELRLQDGRIVDFYVKGD